MRPLLATLAGVVLLAGCGGGPTPSADPATGPSAGDSVEDAGEPTARVDRGRAIADAPTSVLRDVRVRRTPRGLDVTTWWGCVDPLACLRSDQAVAASGDDFATATYDQAPRGQALRRLGGADRRRSAGHPACRPPADW
ncbi:hypothetical protein G6553_02455 [Nocardioides sp. IC4_145]|uniref:hypothetical protein n=1 Tax=Nocardioides sp. IC4_145 TaxID=2714037 RepID=UPI00140E4937|nr:hypothetical protein [Nocardioides sp. IC4_145]NHC22035.1 hypothetical protein [Nocardioides sp. IC4_145]